MDDWSKLLDYGFGGMTLLVVGWVGLRLTAAIDHLDRTVSGLRDEVTAYSSRLNTLLDVQPRRDVTPVPAPHGDEVHGFRRRAP